MNTINVLHHSSALAAAVLALQQEVLKLKGSKEQALLFTELCGTVLHHNHELAKGLAEASTGIEQVQVQVTDALNSLTQAVINFQPAAPAPPAAPAKVKDYTYSGCSFTCVPEDVNAFEEFIQDELWNNTGRVQAAELFHYNGWFYFRIKGRTPDTYRVDSFGAEPMEFLSQQEMELYLDNTPKT
jgi:hypothetical protein